MVAQSVACKHVLLGQVDNDVDLLYRNPRRWLALLQTEVSMTAFHLITLLNIDVP